MRRPSTKDELLAWHTAALNGENPERHDGIPEAGWYRMRRVKNGPWIPVTIFCRRQTDDDTGELTCDEKLIADVDGTETPADAIWTHLRPITQEDHDKLVTRRERRPHDDFKPIDLTATPTAPRGTT